jgi:DNA replication and repair protein RecF
MGSVRIGRLRVDGCRNILDVGIDLGGDPAFFSGANGSGKTSLLEAVYVLSRGRSFRGRRSGQVKTMGLGRMLVGADMVDETGETVSRLFYERGDAWRRRLVDGRAAEEVGEWVDRLPVRLLGEVAADLLDSDPAIRRGFLDLNLFHVEQNGFNVLRRFRRALAQRNAWLRAGGGRRGIWDEEFIASSLELHSSRSRLLEAAWQEFETLSLRFDFVSGAKLRYRQGWPDGVDLKEALRSEWAGGGEQAFTRVGPQRADFSVEHETKGVGWSRGQAKVVVYLMQMALDRVQVQRRGLGAVWLVDDMWADLDEGTGRRLLDLVLNTGSQCLLTGVGERVAGWRGRVATEIRMFHVKQGKVIRVD